MTCRFKRLEDGLVQRARLREDRCTLAFGAAEVQAALDLERAGKGCFRPLGPWRARAGTVDHPTGVFHVHDPPFW